MPSYAITGAARGLGFEFINQLSASTSNTAFALVRDFSTATKLKDLATTRKNIHILQSDVTKPAELIAAASAIADVTGGSLDVLVHNAVSVDMSTIPLPPSAYTPEAADMTRFGVESSLGTAVYGTLWVTNALLPLIEKGHEKKIVLITSGMVDLELVKVTGISYAVPYAVAKAGLNIFAAKFAAELQEKGIKVLALSPGWVDTNELAGPPPPAFIAAFQD